MSDSAQPTLPPGFRLIARDSVGSTNEVARELIAAGAAAGAVVWAESQTAGRGRQGNEWVSPPGNLYCSIVLRPKVEPGRLGEISLVAALAVRDAVAAQLPTETPVELKWPNDVLAAGRKIAGILVEAEKLPDEAATAVIVGIGVNIVSAPKETSYPATCIAALTRTPKVSMLLGAVVASLDRRIDGWSRGGFAPVREEWMSHAHRVGSQIAASGGVSGAFAGLDETGAILIAAADGARHRLVSGSIRYL